MRNTSPVGWRVTRYDYINRQLYNGADGLGYLNANPPDLWLSADKGLATVGARELSGNNFFQSSSYDVPFSTNSFTVDLWARASVFQRLTFFFGSGGGSASEPGIVLLHSSNNQAGFLISDGSSVHSIYGYASTSVDWKHYVAVIDRVSNTASLYVNSSLVASTSIVGMGSISSTQTGIGIGNIRFTGSTTYTFVGGLSKIKLYLGYAYTQTDVDESYALGNGLFAAELSSNLFVRLSHAWNLNEAAGRALDCVSTWHLNESGSSTTIASTDGPRESIVADNSGNDYHLKLVNYSASQKVTNWVTDSDGSEGLRFERASGHYCLGTTDHAFRSSTEGFKVGSIAVKFKWQGSTNNVTEQLCAFEDWLWLGIASDTKRIRFYNYNAATSYLGQVYTNANSVDPNSTSWVYALCTIDGNVFSTDATYRAYVNGVLNSTQTSFPTTIYQGRTLQGIKFSIGGRVSSSNFFNGIIDYVKVFNVVLTTSDAVAQAAGSTFAVAPVMDYTFNDGPQESGVSNGDSIAGWKSREGRNYEFNQGTLANRPTWVANANHGQPGILFDGTNDYLVCNNKVLNGDYGVVFAVHNTKSTSPRTIYCQANNTSTGAIMALVTYKYNYTLYSESVGSSNNSQIRGNIDLTTSFVRLSRFNSNGSAYSFYVNSKLDTLTTLAGPNNGRWFGDFNTTDINNASIGAGYIGSSMWLPSNLNLLELIAFDSSRIPSNENALAIERYLLTKYGIST